MIDASFFVPLLALFTLLFFTLFALFNKKKVEDRRHDPKSGKSALASDGPEDGE